MKNPWIKKVVKNLWTPEYLYKYLKRKTGLRIRISYKHNGMKSPWKRKLSLPRRAPGLPMFSTRAMQVYNYNLTQIFFTFVQKIAKCVSVELNLSGVFRNCWVRPARSIFFCSIKNIQFATIKQKLCPCAICITK